MDDATLQKLYGSPPPMGNYAFGAMVGIPAPSSVSAEPMRKYRPHHLGQPFDLRARFKKAYETPIRVIGCCFPSNEVLRISAAAGYDAVFIDWEHSPMGIKEICDYVRLIQMSGEGNTAAVVRVPNFDHHNIAWLLDAGASGIIVPHTETVEQVKAIVKACRFRSADFPEGGRSFPPSFVPSFTDGVPEGETIFDSWNKAAVIVQVESKLGCDNVAALAAVPGVDCLMVGSGDLRIDLGLPPGLDGPEESYQTAITKVVTAAKKHNLGCLAFAMGKDMIVSKLEAGFNTFVLANEGWLLAAAARNVLNEGFAAEQEWRERVKSKDANGKA